MQGYIELNIISAAVLIFFLFYASKVINRRTILSKTYIAIMIINFLIIVLELFNNIALRYSSGNISAQRILGCIYLSVFPLMPYLLLACVRQYFSKAIRTSKTIDIFLVAIICINVILSILSSSLDIFFRINDVLELTRGPVFLYPLIIGFIFNYLSTLLIIKNKKMLIHSEYIFFITVSLIPIGLGSIQMLLGHSYIYASCNTFVLVLFFIILQQRELYKDSLTGARNRLAFDKCLQAKVENINKFSIIIIDIDYFKKINDTFGHCEGDYVLKVFVKILQKTFNNKGMVFRMGGDEFIILIDAVTPVELNDMQKNMEKAVEKYNSKGLKPYRIKFSYSCGTYSNKDVSIDQFINELDIRMYDNKNSKKVLNTRNEYLDVGGSL